MIILSILFLSLASQIHGKYNITDWENLEGIKLCSFRKDEPTVQPNAYFCNASDCCIVNGAGSCCIYSTPLKTWFNKAILPMIFFTVCLLAMGFFYCFYSDSDIDYENLAKDSTGWTSVMFPQKRTDTRVSDPIFEQNKQALR